MIIYAIFLCMIGSGCQSVPRPGDANEPDAPPYYETLSHCQEDLLKWYAGGWRGSPVEQPKLDHQGRYVIQDGEWYECLSRHVDTWQQPQ